MALDASATIIPGRGTLFVTEDLTAKFPDYKTVDPRTPSTFTGWDCLGHTSRENTVALSKDGGDAEQVGSWWDAALRETREATTWSWSANSLQVDALTMGLAFPSGKVENGAFWVPGADTSKPVKVFILMVDGTGRMGIGLPNTSVAIGDAPEIAVDGFFEIQLSGSILSDEATGNRIGFFHKNFDTVKPPIGG